MAKPSKKATIITVAILAVLLIVAIVAVAVFLRDKGSTEAAGMESEQTVGQNENAETKTSEEPNQETQSAQESSTPSGTNTLGEIASNANQQTTNEGTTQNAGTQGTTTSTGTAGTTNAGTSNTNGSSSTVGTNSSNGTTTSTENIQESTITRTDIVNIPERKLSEDHNVWWEPMSISALLASANPTTNDIVDVEKSGNEEVVQGETINYTIKVTNKTDKKLEGIEVKDVLPEEVDLNSIQYETEPKMVEGNIVKWNVDIEPNAEVEIKFSVKVKTTVAPDTEIKNSAIANGKTSNEVITKVDEATVSVPVSKEIVSGESDAAKAYPISGAVVTLNGTDGSTQSVTLNDQNGYKYEFTNLLKYDAQGNEITYTAEESAIKGEEEEFKHYKQDESKGEGQFVNTFDPATVQEETTELPVHKDIVTNNSDAAKAYAITGVVVTLKGTEVAPITLNEANNYTGKFTGLKKYDEEGNLIKYNAEESAIAEEEAAFNHYTKTENEEGQFVNTFDPSTVQDKTELTVTKTWDDMDNKFNTRPESGAIKVNLKANGKIVQKDVSIKASEGWTYTFRDLNKYDSTGKIIDYTVEEELIPNYNYPPTYNKTDNGYEIVNKADLKETSIDKTVVGIKQVGSENPNTIDTEIPQPDLDENGIEKTYKLNASLGDTIIYNIRVNNDGNTKLNNVTVTDDKAVTIIGVTPITNGIEGNKAEVNIPTTANTNLLLAAVNKTTLDVGEGYIFTVSYTLGQADIADVSEFSNKATIDSDETDPESSTSTVNTNVKFDHELTKKIMSVEGRDVSNPTQTIVDSSTIVNTYSDKANKGETITYKITAENKGTTTISNLKLTDNRDVYVESIKFSTQKDSIPVNKNITVEENLLNSDTYELAPGETVEVVVTYEIGSMSKDNTGAEEVNIENITNLYGDAFDPSSNDPNNSYKDVEDEARAEITATMKANISISKKSDKGNKELEPGDKIKYTVTLTNSSPVEGTAKVKESVPTGTTLVSDVTVKTSKSGTNNPTKLSPEQIETMSNGELELTVPGNGNVVITFTVEVQNSAIATTVKNQASIDNEDKTSEKIENPIKKALNIYETKTELGKQSVVIVVDMTLSLAAGVETDNTDRLAYAPVNADGSINYRAGYENTRWYKLKTALDSFIDSYLGENPGNKKSVAIVGFCKDIVLDSDGFITSAKTAKDLYKNIFTFDQYKAAVDFGLSCKENPDNMLDFLEKHDKDRDKQTPFKENEDGTYDIDVDVLSFLDDTGYYEGKVCGLGSGTNIPVGLKNGEKYVSSQTKNNIPTDLIVITDGENNQDNDDEIAIYAKDIMDNSIKDNDNNKVNSKLYAIGFTADAETFEDLLNGNMTEYYTATDTTSLNKAFTDIKGDTERNPEPIRPTTSNEGWVSLKDISFANNSVITFYTGSAIQTDTSTTIVKYDNFEEFKNAKDKTGKAYYNSSNNTFNLKQFLIDNNVKAGATINMEVYTVE